MYNVQIVDNGEVKHFLGVVDIKLEDDFIIFTIKKGGIYDRVEKWLDGLDSVVISLDRQTYYHKMYGKH